MRRSPRARGSRWLLFLTALGAGAVGVWFAVRTPTPAATEVPAIRFVDVTDSVGIRFRHHNGAVGKKLLPETMGAGVAVLDYDGDGRPDLFFVNGRPWPGDPNPAAGPPTQALYRNRGDGTFDDVTAAVGLDVELFGLGVAVGDFDNDGRPDIFVTAVGGNRLFRNAGARFEDVTEAAGLGRTRWPTATADEFARRVGPLSFPASAVWLDYDGDGRLDLFVCNYLTWSPARDLGVPAVLPDGVRAYVPPQQFAGAHCELFRNLGGGRFEDVSAAAGARVAEAGSNSAIQPVGKALGVVVCDPDGDGWPDVVVANDTVRNFYFHNEPAPGGGRAFRESGLVAGIAYSDGRPRGGMGIDAAEIEPGKPAVLIANFTHEPNSLFQLVRKVPVQFADVAPEVGLAGTSRAPMKFGAVFADFDRDGRPDLFTANGHLEPDIGTAYPGQTYRQPGQLFRNTGKPGGLFEPVPGSGGGELFPPMVGRGCAYLDYDGDGRLDLVVTENNGRARLFRNETQDGNASLRLALVGDGRGTNRDALGAEVFVEAGGAVRRHYVTGSHGYLSQSESVLTVGIGTAKGADKVSVRWPGAGVVETWTELEPGAVRVLRQGTGRGG